MSTELCAVSCDANAAQLQELYVLKVLHCTWHYYD